jgi:hypothetical protein
VIDRSVALILDEGKWLTASMILAAVAVAVLFLRQRRSARSIRHRVLAAMNLSAGLTIATMAFGHLLAVGLKLAMGTLRQRSLLILIAIGVSLLIPSWLVTRHTRALLASDDEDRQTTVLLNAWLVVTLLALGLHNIPLAAPALFTIAYRLHSGRLVGWAIVSLAVAFTLGLFGASLVFLASGQTFEQFSGRE